MPLSRMRLHLSELLFCQSDSGKLPTRLRWKKIAITRANMCLWSRARASAQHHLSAHEFPVIFTQRSGQRLKSRITEIGARCPLPAVSPKLARVLTRILRRGWRQPLRIQEIAMHRISFRCHFPLQLRWQPLAGPARVSVGFKVADMAHRRTLNFLQWNLAAEGGQRPALAFRVPVTRCAPAVLLHRIPSRRQPEFR